MELRHFQLFHDQLEICMFSNFLLVHFLNHKDFDKFQ